MKGGPVLFKAMAVYVCTCWLATNEARCSPTPRGKPAVPSTFVNTRHLHKRPKWHNGYGERHIFLGGREAWVLRKVKAGPVIQEEQHGEYGVGQFAVNQPSRITLRTVTWTRRWFLLISFISFIFIYQGLFGKKYNLKFKSCKNVSLHREM